MNVVYTNVTLPRAMLTHDADRYLVLLAMTVTFIILVGLSVDKFKERSIGETQSIKKASEMYFPSLVLCPFLASSHVNNSRLNDTTKNLTEYYLNRLFIRDSVVSIHQQYMTEDGLVLLKLNISPI